MITVRQVKAARALLDWTQDDLAERSGMSLAAVNKLEREMVSPRKLTFEILQQTFEKAGVEFTEGMGVRLTDNVFNLQTLTGKQAPIQLLDDIFNTLRITGGEVLLSGINEDLWKDYTKEVAAHQKRMREHNIKPRALLCLGDTNMLPYIDKEVYRWIPKELFTQLLYYVYADKFALMVWGKPIRITIIQNAIVADTFRRQFEMNWKNGRKPY